MTLRAVLRDGTEVDLAPKYRTVDDVMRLLAPDALTGSAVPFAEVKLKVAGGGEVAYADINAFTDREEEGR